MILNSSVHTRLAHILTPVTSRGALWTASVVSARDPILVASPSTSAPTSIRNDSGVTASHQHFRAGFRQNKRSFWLVAVPAGESPCLSMASASDVMHAFCGSMYRFVHVSFASKPDAQSISIRCCSAVPVDDEDDDAALCVCDEEFSGVAWCVFGVDECCFRRPSKIEAFEMR